MTAEISYFLLAFTSIITIINPFSSMPMYLDITGWMSAKNARKFAWKANVAAFMAMIIFALFGTYIFKLFSIDINGLKLVGGILFFMMGYDLLQGKKARTKSEAQVDESKDLFESAITPFGIPMICGPGALTVTTVLIQDAINYRLKTAFVLSILATCIVNYLLLIFSKQILGFLGPSGNKVFFRLMGLILMMIAVEFFFNGLKHYIHLIMKTA